MKYSLFLLERQYGGWGSELTEECFEYIATYDTLEEAIDRKAEWGQKTIILASW